jgi:hypothetical protein
LGSGLCEFERETLPARCSGGCAGPTAGSFIIWPMLAPGHGQRLRRLAVAAAVCLVQVAVGCGAGADSRPGTQTAAAADRSVRCAVARRPAPPARSGLLVGQHAGLRFFSGSELCVRARLARRSGARILREDFGWADIEPRPGDFAWRRSDEVVAAAATQGLTLLPLLHDTPDWAGKASTSIPTDAGPYARFVARVAARYGPRGSFWRAHRELPYRPAAHLELWNEPYLPQFSDGNPDPANYARLVRDTVRVARRANPLARFLIEGDTSWTSDNESFRDDWMQELYAAVPDLGRWFDGVAVHPYSDDPPDAFTPGPRFFRQTRRLEEVRRALLAHGDRAKHLWITEIGWSTCGGDSGGCVSEPQQAEYLQTLFGMARGIWRPYLDAVVVYQLIDSGASDGSKEGHFGLLRASGARKPAWSEFVRLAGGA